MFKKIKNLFRRFILLLKEEKKFLFLTPISAPEFLKDKVGFITGGSGGICLAMAESFIKSGAKVIIAGTNEEKLRSCCEKISGDEPIIHSY